MTIAVTDDAFSDFKPREVGRNLWVLRDSHDRCLRGVGMFGQAKDARNELKQRRTAQLFSEGLESVEQREVALAVWRDWRHKQALRPGFQAITLAGHTYVREPNGGIYYRRLQVEAP